MAFDGITVAALVHELKVKMDNARFFKIAQPESDELNITIKNNKDQIKLLLSANASLPLAYITEYNKANPLVAPNFCMLLRKHIGTARILDVYQPGLERIIVIKLEHYNEMGDLCKKELITELMGKHSNIIFTDDQNKIIDSIKHVNGLMSSIREVLPGREYFVPDTMNKHNPLDVDDSPSFTDIICSKASALAKAIYTSFTGISPIIAEEICYRADIDSSLPTNVLTEEQCSLLFSHFSDIMCMIKEKRFEPNIVYENNAPLDFSPIKLKIYKNLSQVENPSMSYILEKFYGEKNSFLRIRERQANLRHIVTSTLEKDYKKYDLQVKQLKDTDKKDKYKTYGTLLTTYMYLLSPEDNELVAPDFETGESITIPIDSTISPIDNAKQYFEKYNKLKRTAKALSEILIETKSEIDHLESILNSLDIAQNEDDLKEIKEELIEYGYIRRKNNEKKSKYVSKPLHYISSDGYHMYVGKNNYQNEELTFKYANGDDFWFHSKNFPGSHVIVKTNGDSLPDRTYEEAASLAAFYSKGRDQGKVEIDYCKRKIVKKVAGAKPGFVIYHSNYSMAIAPDISNIKKID